MKRPASFASLVSCHCLLLSIAAATCTADSPSPAPPTSQKPNPRFVHEPSGISFPETLDGYTFVGRTPHNVEGTDVSFGWNTQDPRYPFAATVYVFPAPRLVSIGSPQDVIESAKARLFDQLWQQQVKAVTDAHPQAAAAEPEAITITLAGRAYSGRRQVFQYEQLFAGGQQQVASVLYLFPFIKERWLLKYRFTYLASQDLQAEMKAFVADVPIRD